MPAMCSLVPTMLINTETQSFLKKDFPAPLRSPRFIRTLKGLSRAWPAPTALFWKMK